MGLRQPADRHREPVGRRAADPVVEPGDCPGVAAHHLARQSQRIVPVEGAVGGEPDRRQPEVVAHQVRQRLEAATEVVGEGTRQHRLDSLTATTRGEPGERGGERVQPTAELGHGLAREDRDG
jgi:hypothetical protein